MNNELFLSKETPIEENEGSGSYNSGFEDVIDELEERRIKTKGQHNRMYSTNTEPKTQHFRVYSNISRD